MPRRSSQPHQAVLAHVGQNVKRVRRARKLTQEKLAEASDLHPRMVQKIEAGDASLTVGTLALLVRALKCRWTDVLPPEE